MTDFDYFPLFGRDSWSEWAEAIVAPVIRAELDAGPDRHDRIIPREAMAASLPCGLTESCYAHLPSDASQASRQHNAPPLQEQLGWHRGHQAGLGNNVDDSSSHIKSLPALIIYDENNLTHNGLLDLEHPNNRADQSQTLQYKEDHCWAVSTGLQSIVVPPSAFSTAIDNTANMKMNDDHVPNEPSQISSSQHAQPDRASSPTPSITLSEIDILRQCLPSIPLKRETTLTTPPVLRNPISGVYDCSRTDCSSPGFKRACEWRKHMDTHDKPWVCPHPICKTSERPHGFTWKGGLTRHLREVHAVDAQGRERERFLCPRVECRRHVGEGFKRRENLREHLRSVHGVSRSRRERDEEGRGGESDSEEDTPCSPDDKAELEPFASPLPPRTVMEASTQAISDIEDAVRSQSLTKRKFNHDDYNVEDEDEDEEREEKVSDYGSQPHHYQQDLKADPRPHLHLHRENKKLRHDLETARRWIAHLEDQCREREGRYALLQRAFMALSREVAVM